MAFRSAQDQFRFVDASVADAERLAVIRVDAMRPSLEAVGRFDPERARTRFLDSFDAADTKIIHAGTAVAGFFVVRRRADHLYLDHLYITPGFQGRGGGQQVIDNLKAEARAASLPIRLMALNGSPANGFYHSCGFEAVSADALDTLYQWVP